MGNPSAICPESGFQGIGFLYEFPQGFYNERFRVFGACEKKGKQSETDVWGEGRLQ